MTVHTWVGANYRFFQFPLGHLGVECLVENGQHGSEESREGSIEDDVEQEDLGCLTKNGQ